MPHHVVHVLGAPHRAKNITNKPRINEDPKDAMLREFQEEIMRLKAALAVSQPILTGLAACGCCLGQLRFYPTARVHEVVDGEKRARKRNVGCW